MSARFQIEGRTAVITGAASGIGAALAEALSERRCHLALADVDQTGLNAVLERVRRPGLNITGAKIDVSQPGEVAAFAASVERDHGAAHLLFNNAGVSLVGAFEEIAAEDFDWLMSINFGGAVCMTRMFLPLLRRADAAHIINISSLFGIIAPAGQTAYAASKYALRGFSDALRHELLGSSVGVTTVHPGGVKTNIARAARAPKAASAQAHDRSVRKAERLLRMPPAKAASIILRAVEQRKPRVLVGADAHIAAWVERVSPTRYWGLLAGERSRQTIAGTQMSDSPR